MAIAVHILVFPPAPGCPTGLQGLNGVAHWHNKPRVVASLIKRFYTAALNGRSCCDSVLSYVYALTPSRRIVHFFSAAYEAGAGYFLFHPGKIKDE